MALGVRNRVLLFLLVRLLFFAPKIGLKSWFSRLLGLIIVGSFLLSAARYDVRYGEGSHSHNKARTLPSSFRSLRSICLNRKNRFSEVNGVQPFQFEPTYPPGQEPVDLEDESESGDRNQRDSRGRIGSTKWCSCEECESMTTEEECFCCRELVELNEKFDESGLFFF